MEIYHLLFEHFGERFWWPGDNPFEVMIGAILTQNTNWKNVEKAILLLKEEGLVTPEAIIASKRSRLLSALKPSGYFNVKAERLLSLCKMVMDYGSGGLNPEVLKLPPERLREALLKVKGVGPETADCIVLYSANYPSFVIDTYTRRLLIRHGLMKGTPSYEEIRGWIMNNIKKDTKLYNEFHALIVAAGHNYCNPRKPSCTQCPLGGDPFLQV
jgi:endonuclease-3 related protein